MLTDYFWVVYKITVHLRINIICNSGEKTVKNDDTEKHENEKDHQGSKNR